MFARLIIVALFASTALANSVSRTSPADGAKFLFNQIDDSDDILGPRSMVVTFTSTATGIDENNFALVTNYTDPDLAISVDSVSCTGKVCTVEFTRNMDAGEQLTVKIDEDDDGTTDKNIDLTFYPGDFDNDGDTDLDDETELTNAINASSTLKTFDFNQDGTVDTDDGDAFDQFQIDFGTSVAWASFVPNSVSCCCTGAACETIIEGSCSGSSATCPCTTSSCP